MCYTATDSIIAYIINFVSSIILFTNTKNKTYKIIALFLLFVGQMQLFDYIFWLNTKCNLTNKIATSFAIIFNHLQPIVLFFLIKNYYKEEDKPSLISKILLLLYILVVIPYTINLWCLHIWKNIKYTSKNMVCCSLPHKPYNNTQVIDWGWNKKPYSILVYSLFILSLFFLSLDLKKSNIILAVVGALVLIISSKLLNHSMAVGRAWCYFVSFMPLLFLVLEYFNIDLQLNINLDKVF